MDFPGCASGKEPVANSGDIRDAVGFDPWVRKIPWRRAWQATPVFLPTESHGQRRLMGSSPQGQKESDMTEATQHACTHGPLYIDKTNNSCSQNSHDLGKQIAKTAIQKNLKL